jgi:hypothetical protein
MSAPLRIGVLIMSKVQLIDLSCIDMFSLVDKTYLTEGGFPAPLRALGRTVEIHYIGGTGTGMLSTTTASLALRLTDGIHRRHCQTRQAEYRADPREFPKYHS